MKRHNGRTDGPTDGRTDGRMDRPSYRVASSRLKRVFLTSDRCAGCCHFWMRSRISIRGCVRPYVRPSVHPSVHRSHTSWNHAKMLFLIKTTISTSNNASYAVYAALLGADKQSISGTVCSSLHYAFSLLVCIDMLSNTACPELALLK